MALERLWWVPPIRYAPCRPLTTSSARAIRVPLSAPGPFVLRLVALMVATALIVAM